MFIKIGAKLLLCNGLHKFLTKKMLKIWEKTSFLVKKCTFMLFFAVLAHNKRLSYSIMIPLKERYRFLSIILKNGMQFFTSHTMLGWGAFRETNVQWSKVGSSRHRRRRTCVPHHSDQWDNGRDNGRTLCLVLLKRSQDGSRRCNCQYRWF